MPTNEDNLKPVTATTIKLSIPLKADIHAVWAAITQEIHAWWPKDFYVYENARLIFEPFPGGRLYEDAGDGNGGLWYTVMNIDSPSSLQMVGHLAPQFGGPATTMLQLKLEKMDGQTMLHLTDALFGLLTPQTQKQVTEGWACLFEQGLKSYLE